MKIKVFKLKRPKVCTLYNYCIVVHELQAKALKSHIYADRLSIRRRNTYFRIFWVMNNQKASVIKRQYDRNANKQTVHNFATKHNVFQSLVYLVFVVFSVFSHDICLISITTMLSVCFCFKSLNNLRLSYLSVTMLVTYFNRIGTFAFCYFSVAICRTNWFFSCKNYFIS